MTQSKGQIEKLFMQYHQDMLRVAVMLLHDEEEAKDIVHDVFGRLLRGETLLREKSARAFLMTSVRNACLNRIRDARMQERAKRLYLLEAEVETTTTEQLEAESRLLLQGMERLYPPMCQKMGTSEKPWVQSGTTGYKGGYKHFFVPIYF
ncbi:MAG: hypothetical protein MJZ60_01470 [Bacteroidaceae bacterium]|nr:hypothetical protein [Bacteroidaceae bacterium]